VDALSNADMGKVIHAALDTGKKVLWVSTAAIVGSLLDMEAKPAPALALIASVSQTMGRQGRDVMLVSSPHAATRSWKRLWPWVRRSA